MRYMVSACVLAYCSLWRCGQIICHAIVLLSWVSLTRAERCWQVVVHLVEVNFVLNFQILNAPSTVEVRIVRLAMYILNNAKLQSDPFPLHVFGQVVAYIGQPMFQRHRCRIYAFR